MGDLLPSAWARFTAENEHIGVTRQRIAECAYPLEELVEASEKVVLVQVKKPDPHTPRFTNPARLLESLKGSASWHAGDVREVWSDPVAPTEILLFEEDSDPIYPHDCGVIRATPQNLLATKAALKQRSKQ